MSGASAGPAADAASPRAASPGAASPGAASPGAALPEAASLEERLQSFVGLSSGPPTRALDEVNLPMIRHWVEAMGDRNPVYLDDGAAEQAGFAGIVAPPTMLQAWIMRGLKATQELGRARAAGEAGGDAPSDRLMAALDEAGYTSVVATDCEQHYERPLLLGDRLEASSSIDAVSAEKNTALGAGRFVTTRVDFTDQDGGPVATMRFRVLKFKPNTGSAPRPRPRRPRPAITRDNAFFFEGTKRHELLIQRCTACGRLRHPPRPACAACRSFDWDTVAASGRGTVYSFVVNHHPQVPAFDYPLVVVLVELEEGTRLVANIAGVEPGDVVIGMPVVAEFVDYDDELTLPVFRPAPGWTPGGEPGNRAGSR